MKNDARKNQLQHVKDSIQTHVNDQRDWNQSQSAPESGISWSAVGLAGLIGIALIALFAYDTIEQKKEEKLLAAEIRALLQDNRGVDVAPGDAINWSNYLLPAWQRLPHECRTTLKDHGIHSDFWSSGQREKETATMAAFLDEQSVNWNPESYATTIHNGIWRGIADLDPTELQRERFFRAMTLFQGFALCDAIRARGNKHLAEKVTLDLSEYDKQKSWKIEGRIGR